MEKNIVSATTTVEFVGNQSNITIGQPSDQKLSIEDLGKIFAGGLSLCIRASKNEGQYMKEIIDYLQSEFVNTESFKDLENFIDWNTKRFIKDER